MKIEKLKSGMIIKNYSELCLLLEVKPTRGKVMKLRLQELERFISFHRVGHKFVIDEVFKVAQEKIDKRKDPKKQSNNSMYSKDIQALIIDILAQSKGNAVYLSTNAFLRKLEMINDNYTIGRNFVPKLSELTQVPQEVCYDFYNNTNIKLRDKLETALKGLRNRALAMWSYSITICVRETKDVKINDLEELKIDNRKAVTFKVNTVHRKATKNERELILKTEKEMLYKMGYDSLQEAFLKGKWKEYKDKVNAMLLEKANIEYYYNSYEVIYNYDNINKARIERLEQEQREHIKNNLNNNINEFINKSAKTTHNRVLKKTTVNTNELIQTSKKYLTYTKTLTDTVINRDAKVIVEELKKPLKAEQLSIDSIVTENENIPF